MSPFNRPVYVVLVSTDFCLELNPPTICPSFRRPLSGLYTAATWPLRPAATDTRRTISEQKTERYATRLFNPTKFIDAFHELNAFSLPLQTRKPLVEKKRRARINESLQELRLLLADPDVSLFSTCVQHLYPAPTHSVKRVLTSLFIYLF